MTEHEINEAMEYLGYVPCGEPYTPEPEPWFGPSWPGEDRMSEDEALELASNATMRPFSGE